MCLYARHNNPGHAIIKVRQGQKISIYSVQEAYVVLLGHCVTFQHYGRQRDDDVCGWVDEYRKFC